VDHHVGANKWPTQLTTPGSAELTARLQAFARLGTKAMAMEVSSHALSQFRADGVPFNVAVFTNLTRDHLDFHYDMEEYFEAKRRLFTELIPNVRVPKGAAINVEDEYGRKLATSLKIPLMTYGESEADITYKILQQDFTGTDLELNIKGAKENLKIAIPCRHNVQNALAAVAAVLLLGLDKEKTLKAISTFPGVKGRLEPVANGKNLHVFVDYAHTDDALKSVLTSLKIIRDSQKQKSKIITVFGCGGDRDRGKRPLMFNAAFGLSDTVIVTSDNPRTEDPNGILDDILRKVKPEDLNKKVFREVDRKKAIAMALNQAQPGDVVLIAGKGHEEYQILGTQRVHFSDSEVVKECLR
jgi:UDP-N-acetylmuramoyl-L-alanyl-D-glutamate--2,6-diaminopimelate ligase